MSIPTATYDKVYDYATYRSNKQKDNANLNNDIYDYNTYRNNKGTYSYQEYRNNKLGITAEQSEPRKTNRGLMDRLFGMLGYSGIVEGIYNVVDDDPDSTFISGLGEGLKYYSLFTNDVSGRHTFSDVLEQLGWENDEGVTASDVGRGVVGFLGDVLLDPLSYVGGAGAAAKVVKGTGTAIKGVDTVSEVSKLLKTLGKSDDVVNAVHNIGKADDITKELKTVLGGVNKSNIEHLKGLNLDDAKKIIRSNYADKVGIELGEDVIEKQAQDLVNTFNKKVLRFAEGGEDLTFGFKNMPFVNKIKIGDRTLDSFYKTLATSEQLRTLGDKTIAPYYNRLAKNLRTSRIGKNLSKYSDLEKLAKTDIKESAAAFHLEQLEKGWARLEKDLPHLKNAERISEHMKTLDEDGQMSFIQSIEDGTLETMIERRKTLLEVKNKLGVETDKEVLRYYDEFLDGLREFKESSGYNEMLRVRKAKMAEGYKDLPPVHFEYGEDYNKFMNAMQDYAKLNPNANALDFYADIDLGKVDLPDLSNEGMEQLKKYLATLKSQSKEYGLSNPTVVRNTPSGSAADYSYSKQTYGININEYIKDIAKHNKEMRDEGWSVRGVFDFDKNNASRNKASLNIDTVGVSPETTAVHETGHALWMQKLSPYARNKITDLFSQYSPTDIENNISKYATESVDEFFAEASTSLRLGVDNEITRQVNKIIKEDTGFDIKEWFGLKLFEDDVDWNDALNYFFKYADNNNIKMNKWYDDINNAYFNSLSEEEKDIIRKLSSVHKNYDEYADYVLRFGDEGLDIGEMYLRVMDDVAKAEFDRDVLDLAKWKALRGRYVEHIYRQDVEDLKKIFADNTPGAFNPETYGIMKMFNMARKDRRTIAEINKAAGKDILETSLADIYLARTLGSNRLCFAYDTQTFLKNNFFKPYKFGSEVIPNHSIASSYKDINDAVRKEAMRKLGIKKIETKAQNEYVFAEKDNILNFINSLSDDGGKWRVTFGPNVPVQKLNDKQAEYLSSIGAEISQVSDDISNHVNVLSRTQKEQLQSNFLNMYDRLMQIWKVNNTIVHPGFHLQNSVSNAYQSFLAIGEDALNMKKIRKAWNVFKNPDPKQTIKIGDKVWTYKELNYAAQKSGVIDEMFHTYELDSSKHGGMLGSSIPAGIDPTNMEKFWLYKWGTKLGTNIEGTQRMNLFISALGKTDNNVEEAVEMVNKFLFDYSDLTDFEQNVMKRIIPFYTFMRKNLPMELEQMFNRPQLFATMQKGVTNFEKLGEDYVDENRRNEWRQEHIQIPNTGYGIADQLPYNQFDKVLDPNKLLGQTTPLIKVPYELYNGEYAYTGIDIDDTGGYLANQGFWTKMINVADKYEDPEEKRNYVLGQLLGFPIGRMYRE